MRMGPYQVQRPGDGSGEVRAWAAVATVTPGAEATTLLHEPIKPWISGMGVLFDQPGG